MAEEFLVSKEINNKNQIFIYLTHAYVCTIVKNIEEQRNLKFQIIIIRCYVWNTGEYLYYMLNLSNSNKII